MDEISKRHVAYVCRYTPLPVIHAAGLLPYRVLPEAGAPDRAGALLHDNLCPHVKLVLDRAVAGQVPELAGVVIVNSCDAMRRLADAWRTVRPDDRLWVVDLPVARDQAGVDRFTGELGRLRDTLEAWCEKAIDDASIALSAEVYTGLAERLSSVSRAHLQEMLNRAVTEDPAALLATLDDEVPAELHATDTGVPLYLFGNVMPDPDAFALLTECGAQVVDDDLCTGSRQIPPMTVAPERDALSQIAEQLLMGTPCARTVDPAVPGALGARVVADAQACGARGVIAHLMKFCDPYLARMPALRMALREAGLPLLVLESDGTLRALGQQRTRIEAFVEMLT